MRFYTNLDKTSEIETRGSWRGTKFPLGQTLYPETRLGYREKLAYCVRINWMEIINGWYMLFLILLYKGHFTFINRKKNYTNWIEKFLSGTYPTKKNIKYKGINILQLSVEKSVIPYVLKRKKKKLLKYKRRFKNICVIKEYPGLTIIDSKLMGGAFTNWKISIRLAKKYSKYTNTYGEYMRRKKLTFREHTLLKTRTLGFLFTMKGLPETVEERTPDVLIYCNTETKEAILREGTRLTLPLYGNINPYTNRSNIDFGLPGTGNSLRKWLGWYIKTHTYIQKKRLSKTKWLCKGMGV